MKNQYGSAHFKTEVWGWMCAVAAITFSANHLALASDKVIVPFRSEWTVLSPSGFLHDPELANPEFDTSWWRPEFDDAGWSGPHQGPFAYGGVNALRSSDPYSLWDPGDGDRYSNYFRHEFATTDSAPSLAIEFVTDDGAVFYLDGQEVLRHNCCVDQFEVPVDDDYLVFADRPGNADSFVTRPILVGQTLAAGSHVLAVSVHQYATVSNALGFEMRLLSRETDEIVIDTGIDTTLAEAGLSGPDRPHGAAGQNPDGVERWEWDRVDAGGENQGLLWFDIPRAVLDGFHYGSATLKLHVDNEGQAASLHRMTVDWLSGADGGDNVTWNNVPGGPGIVPGVNAQDIADSATDDLRGREGQVVEIDVTQDVLAWSSGQPNYGWAFLPTGGDAAAVSSFESVFAPVPELVIRPGDSDAFLQAGDADQDLDFDQLDLVQVQIASKYLTNQPATWGEGDWDGAPGGSPDSPPAGDGLFNQIDLIAALRHGLYRAGPYATVAPHGAAEDGQTSIGYDARTGRLWLDAPAGVQLTSIYVESASGIFRGDSAHNLGGSFDHHAADNIFKATFGGSFGSVDFGSVALSDLAESFLLDDLTVVGSLSGGGGLGEVDLIYVPVPEPSSGLMLVLGLLSGVILICGRPLNGSLFLVSTSASAPLPVRPCRDRAPAVRRA